jgi:hypothetical protein
MEYISTQSPLPYYHVEHEEDERDLPFSNDDCDSSLDSYDSYQLIWSDHLDDTDEDDDLAEVMFGSPVMDDFSVPLLAIVMSLQPQNLPKSTLVTMTILI